VAGVAGIASATARCDPTATSDRGIAGVTWGASAGDNVVAVSLSSSDCAGPLVRFELFADFLDCFGFFVILFPP